MYLTLQIPVKLWQDAGPALLVSGMAILALMLAGNLMAGWQMARAMLVALEHLAGARDTAFMQAKITTARFYADHILTRAPGMRDAIVDGADSVNALALDSY